MSTNTSNDAPEFGRRVFFAAGQDELWRSVKAMQEHWSDAVQSQFQVGAELLAEIGSARALPDILNACQVCAKRRTERMTEDGKLLLDDYQRCADAAAECLLNALSPATSGSTTAAT